MTILSKDYYNSENKQLPLSLTMNVEEATSIYYQPNSSAEIICNTALNYLSPCTWCEHKINQETLIRGAKIKWEEARLQKMHDNLEKLGGQSVKLKTRNGDLIDSMLFEQDNFWKKIKEFGGKDKEIEIQYDFQRDISCDTVQYVKIGDISPISHNAIQVKFPDAETAKTHLEKLKTFASQFPLEYFSSKDPTIFYLVDSKDSENASIHLLNPNPTIIAEPFPEDLRSYFIPQSINQRIIEFPNNTSVKEFLSKNKMKKSSAWIPFEHRDKVYLIPRFSEMNFKLITLLDPTLQHAQSIDQSPPLSDQNTIVLMGQNQTEIYEMYSGEIFTFLLEGVSVMAFNNAQKGLSRGFNNKFGINQAPEAALQFILEKTGREEKDIIAKGQCSGGLPLFALGKNHKGISIWNDQAPANIRDVVKKKLPETLQGTANFSEDQEFAIQMKLAAEKSCMDSVKQSLYGVSEKIISFLSSSNCFISCGSMCVSHHDYDGLRDFEENDGHKIFTISTPITQNGVTLGGDDLVPSEHSQGFIKIIESTKEKIGKYIPIPGGKHVTPWTINPTSYSGVVRFFQDISALRDSSSSKQEEDFIVEDVSDLPSENSFPDDTE